MVYLSMEKNPLDIIQTKFCRQHQCFTAFRNGKCIRCDENVTQELLSKGKEVIKEFDNSQSIDVPVKRGRGRPKGSKKLRLINPY